LINDELKACDRERGMVNPEFSGKGLFEKTKPISGKDKSKKAKMRVNPAVFLEKQGDITILFGPWFAVRLTGLHRVRHFLKVS